MNARPEVACIGEAILDFVSTVPGTTLKDAPGFVKAAGGAPANVAVGLARLGTRSAFVGRVGDDAFGRFIARELRRAQVNTAGIRFDPAHKTRLAFVSLMKDGGRDFEFWERQPADGELRVRDVSLRSLAQSRIVHISSFMLLQRGTRATALNLAHRISRRGGLVSFDPNLRLSLWKSKSEARRVTLRMIRRCAVLRLNDEESGFLTGSDSLSRAAAELRSLGPSLVVITMGKQGCFYQNGRASGTVKGFRVRAVDTTGCGDAFLAGLLHRVVRERKEPGDLDGGSLHAMCRFANAVGALASLRRGAIAAMPTIGEVHRFLEKN